jgi:trehalose/maltose hydrolase-like predicted phosphorylase
MDKELIILYLKYLYREPTSQEIYDTSTKIISSPITLLDIESDIKNTQEYKQLHGISSEEISYNSVNNTLTVNNIDPKIYDGVLISNGKIGIKTAPTPFRVERAIISANYTDDKVKEFDNTINVFDFTQIKLKDLELDSKSYKQMLNMHLGVFTHEYNMISKNNDIFSIKHELFAFRQYPFCFNSTISITNHSEIRQTIELVHSIQKSSKELQITDISNNKIDDVQYFTIKGKDNTNLEILNNNSYILGGAKLKGYNGDRDNVFEITLEPNESMTFIIISCVCTSDDFRRPFEESIKILDNIYNNYTESLINHNKRWIDLWNKSNITFNESDDITEFDKTNLDYMQQTVRFGLYSIFSLIREDSNVEINPLNLSLLDVNGKIYYDAEMFLIPIMLVLNPLIARQLIDLRYIQLEEHKELTKAYGYKGINIPYKNTILGVDVENPFYVMNTGFLAYHVWNYYRVSNDIEWLETKGYKIIKNCALFFASLLEPVYNENINNLFVRYRVKEVYTINNNFKEDNTTTLMMIQKTLEYYLQCTYRLEYTPISHLKDIYSKLVVSTKSVIINNNKVLPTRITIKVINNSYHFYDSETSQFIGSDFGTIYKSFLIVSDETTYIIDIPKEYILQFYSEEGAKITLDENSSVISSINGYSNGFIYIKGSDLHSITCSNVFVPSLLTRHLFVRENRSIIISSIYDVNLNYDKAPLQILEPFILLMSYYSKNLHPSIILNNMIYYRNLYNKELTVNKLILNNFNIYLSQNLVNVEERRLMNFISGRKLHADIQNVRSPWGNYDDMYFYLFNIIYGIASFEINGALNENNFFIESLELRSTFKNNLPQYIDSVVLKYNNLNLYLKNTFDI